MQLGSPQYPRNPMKGASEHFHFLSVLAGGPGSAPPALVSFVASIRAAGQCFCGRAVVFHFRRLARAFSRSKRSWLCTAQNFQAGGTCCNSAKRELEIIAKPLRLLHESLLSGRSFLTPCAQKLATTLCPSSLSPAVCQFVLVAARRFLQSALVALRARPLAALLSLRSIC